VHVHTFDLHVYRMDGKKVGVDFKPAKLVKPSEIRELHAVLARRISPRTADELLVLTPAMYTRADVYNAELMHTLTRQEFQDDDETVLRLVRRMKDPAPIADLVARSKLAGYGFNSVVRAIAEGHLRMTERRRIEYGAVVARCGRPERSMVKVRHIPGPVDGAFGQPERMRFDDDDRIVIDEIDWRRHLTNDDGHILQAAHDAKIKREITHARMKIEAGKSGFRHDRHWYATGAMTARLRADVAEMNDLPFAERQMIMWKEDFLSSSSGSNSDIRRRSPAARRSRRSWAASNRIIVLRHGKLKNKGKRNTLDG